MKNSFLVAAAIVAIGCGAPSAYGLDADVKDIEAQLAIEMLSAKLSIPEDEFEVVRVSMIDWPDASLGCPKPGTQYLQVITRGAMVVLRAEKKFHRVHTGNNRAITCDLAPQGQLLKKSASLPGANVQDLMLASQEDLARRLGVNPADIEIAGVQTQVWPNSALGCGAPGQDYAAAETSGYRVKLDYKGRVYAYHTDQERVIPCPAIETE